MLDPLLDPNVSADALDAAPLARPTAVGGPTSQSRSASMLELHHRQGHRHAIPYSHLVWMSFDPSLGIKLHFATHTVRIRGRNLRPVYEQLVAHTCGVLRECDPSEDTGDEDATLISRLVFRPIRRGRAIPPVRQEKRPSTREQKS